MAKDDIAIKVENVSKTFKLPHEKTTSIKSAIINFYRKNRTYETQQVLTDISFEIKKGEFFGIVGRNGSGKSTLLKLLAGIYTPTSGHIHLNGSLTPFIELGVGFNPELTGRENVFLNGSLLGFSRKQMEAMYDDIVEFAEIERFMDQKLKNYSSGMQVRLAFSIAIRARSDILLLDEVLAVGDAAFQKKCYDYFMELKKNKSTVILVTHDMSAVRQYCNKAMMLEKGKISDIGRANKVAQSYNQLFVNELVEKEQEARKSDTEEDRWGNGKMKASAVRINTDKRKVKIVVDYEAEFALPPPILGFTIYGPLGNNILEGNTLRQNVKTQRIKPGQHIQIIWDMPNVFATGTYTISVACCDQSTTLFYDWLNKAATFEVLKEGATAGVVDPELKVKLIA